MSDSIQQSWHNAGVVLWTSNQCSLLHPLSYRHPLFPKQRGENESSLFINNYLYKHLVANLKVFYFIMYTCIHSSLLLCTAVLVMQRWWNSNNFIYIKGKVTMKLHGDIHCWYVHNNNIIRKALYLAYNTLTSPGGIGFHDFLLFMQHYRPRLSKHNVMWP